MADTSSYIMPLDFCEIVTDKMQEEGVKRGQLVYVAGYKALPVSDTDPYNQRIKFFCNLVDKEGHVDPHLYVIDPVTIQKVSKSKQKKLTKLVKVENEPNSTH